MSTVAASAQPYVDRFDTLHRERALPEWLLEQKRVALARFASSGFPEPRAEEWKYTNTRPLSRKPFAVTSSGTLPSRESLDAAVGFRLESVLQLVFVDGRFTPELSTGETELSAALPAGALLAPLARQLERDAEPLRPILDRVVSHKDNPFAALNSAFVNDGVLLALPAGQRIESPIHLLFVSTAEQEPSISHPRILIHADSGSEAVVIEDYVGLDGSSNFINPLTEIELKANAGISHYLLQRQAQQSYQIGSIHVNQQRDSRFRSHNIQLGGKLARTDINVKLAEPGSETLLNGLFMVNDRQHVDNHTRIHHAAPHTRSEEVYRGVAGGHGRGVFKGRVLVDRDSQKIEAHQSNANLILSREAEIDTKPELEIYADDVICSHGATVGQLDESSLFYLRSRGFDEALARGILTFAFADEVVSRIELKPLRDHLEQIIVGRLPDSEVLKSFV